MSVVTIMEGNRREQIEALEVLLDFNARLLKNIPILVKELTGERLDDTDNFIRGIIEAMNWEIQVMNGTMDLLNEGEMRIDKDGFNEKIVALGKAYADKQDKELAEALEAVLPYFERLGQAVAEVIH